MSSSGPLVAIDGPGGSGKSTVARGVADALGLEWLDTGAMYRAVTLLALRRGVPTADDQALGRLAASTVIEVGPRVLMNDVDVTEEIRSGEIDANVSYVAANPSVRSVLVERQRAWALERGAGVLEGRDIGSVVLPDADVKVYLTASEAERARRRRAEHAAGGQTSDLVATRAAISARDVIDAGRADSPLVVAEGAVVIDSTGRSADDVVSEIAALARQAVDR